MQPYTFTKFHSICYVYINEIYNNLKKETFEKFEVKNILVNKKKVIRLKLVVLFPAFKYINELHFLNWG